MQERSAGQIIGMRMNESEENHRGRRRTGYHVYMSQFFGEFKILSTEEQRETLRTSGVSRGVVIKQDDESLDSTDSRLYTIKHHDLIR